MYNCGRKRKGNLGIGNILYRRRYSKIQIRNLCLYLLQGFLKNVYPLIFKAT